MAWIHGNNPVGVDYNTGRILCEAMYAINEKEAAIGIAATVWSYVGSYPAVNALTPFDADITHHQTLITEMRGAIEWITAMSGVGVPYYVNAGYVAYDKAGLLTEAFGAADWCSLAGKGIDDVEPVSEILKAAELLFRIENTGTETNNDDRYKIWWIGPGQPTRIAARAAADALPQSGFPRPYGGWYEVSNWNVAPSLYYRYLLVEYYTEVTFNGLPAALTPLDIRIRGTTFAGGGVGTVYGQASPRYFQITAAQFAAPTWGDIGTQRHTFVLPAAPAAWSNWFDDPSFVVGGTDIYYFKVRQPVLCPWPSDTVSYGISMFINGTPQYTIYYTVPMTYN